MADATALDNSVNNLAPSGSPTEPISTSTQEPISQTSQDPITGNNTGSSSSSYSDSSNGNQVAVLSSLDYSTNLTVNNTTQHITYNTVNNYTSQPMVAAGQASAGAAAAAATGSSITITQSRGTRIPMESSLYFRGGRIDRIIGFDTSSGAQLALSTRVFRGIGQMEYRSVNSKRDLQKASRTSVDILYLQGEGKLYFNANGDGRGFGRSGGLFAIMDQNPVMTADHFLVV